MVEPVPVMMYHSVAPEIKTWAYSFLSIAPDVFEDQISTLARAGFVGITLEELYGYMSGSRRIPPRAVVLTFDDGYLDNYEFAVPVLLRHQIPAAFFVSTGMIGEQCGFPHDLSKLGKALPNMSWDQLREMQAEGFTIGSHTVSHLSCGKSDLDAVARELNSSMAHLKQELDLDRVIFAYPYGGRDDMNPQALELVKQTGYAACLSAYGGVNRNGVDRFNVLRMGVDFRFSPLAFAARAEGW